MKIGILNIASSLASSTARGWLGSKSINRSSMPEKLIELFDIEGCPKCRLVREAITELDLDMRVIPCPKGGSKNLARLKELSEQDNVPFLFDPNTNKKLVGAKLCIEYLFNTYSSSSGPLYLKENAFNKTTSEAASLLRGSKGLKASRSKSQEQDWILYSFESSPFTRPVRERLCELELTYQLINLGKQQMSDMGPPNFRFSLKKEYVPVENSKREKFFQEHGDVQVPYLIDPNTDKRMFESADILVYLDHTYAL